MTYHIFPKSPLKTKENPLQIRVQIHCCSQIENWCDRALVKVLLLAIITRSERSFCVIGATL